MQLPIPASANVCYYSILFQGYSPSAYVGDSVLLYGYNFNVNPNVPWIGASTITEAGQILQSPTYGQYGNDSSQYIYLGYNTSTPNQAIVQSGDSGSPTFLVYGGQLYLAGPIICSIRVRAASIPSPRSRCPRWTATWDRAATCPTSSLR